MLVKMKVMHLTPKKINLFNLVNLPAVYFTGIRVKNITDTSCTATVTLRWINQNPFKSMFWAVQGMAAELTTGALLLAKIKESKQQVSMLVLNNNASFTKKATGKISFSCSEGNKIATVLEKALATGVGQTLWLQSVGKNVKGEIVSTFNFEWTIKLKNNTV